MTIPFLTCRTSPIAVHYAFDGIPEWDAFREHCGTYRDCKDLLGVIAER
jgi:hypothetical protein